MASNYGTDGSDLMAAMNNSSNTASGDALWNLRGGHYGNAKAAMAGADLDISLGGGAVQRAGSKISVDSYAECQPNDLITINGMEVRVADAKAIGLLKPGAVQQTQQMQEQAAGKEWADAKADAEEAALSEPLVTDAVIHARDEFALSTGSEQAATEVAHAIANDLVENGGAVSNETIKALAEKFGSDPVQIEQMIAPAFHSTVNAVKAVLGKDGYAFIQNAATHNKVIDQMVGNLSYRTAIGQASMGDWKKLLNTVKRSVQG